MLSDFLETLQIYFKDKPYWAKMQPIFVLLSLHVAATALLYQYLRWEYSITPPLFLYFRSYLFKQLSLFFLAIGITLILLRWQDRREEAAVARESAAFSRWDYIAPRLLISIMVLTVTVSLFIYISPSKVSHIRVKFLSDPINFNGHAFVYLLYELNKRQKHWYYEVDFDVFNANALTSKEREACAQRKSQSFCHAELLAGRKLFIGITSESLGEDFFWQNRQNVSTISSFDWEKYAPPSIYDLLAYVTIVQSMVIHLNTHCTSTPIQRESRVAYGDLFQHSPQRTTMKAQILAAHLSPQGEALLLNCFGIEYMKTMSAMLTLDWLHTDPVRQNLITAFGIPEQAKK